MVADLAQAISFVSYGNAFLSGLISSPPDFHSSNTAFKYASTIQFTWAVPEKSKWYRKFIGRERDTFGDRHPMSPSEWFLDLKHRNVSKLLLQQGGPNLKLDPHIGVAFAGFLNWWIYGTRANGAESWCGGIGRDPSGQQPRIWAVRYIGHEYRQMQVSVHIEAARNELRDALEKILVVARSINSFVDWFDNAIAQLDASDPGPRFHADMLPDCGYSREARQLAFAASAAWVFGGMGSWNDNWVEPAYKKDYDICTKRLYQAVLNALISSTNSFDPSIQSSA